MASSYEKQAGHGQFSFPSTFTEKKLVIPSTGEVVDRKPVAEALRNFARQIRSGRSASEVLRSPLTK